MGDTLDYLFGSGLSVEAIEDGASPEDGEDDEDDSDCEWCGAEWDMCCCDGSRG